MNEVSIRNKLELVEIQYLFLLKIFASGTYIRHLSF